MQGAFQHLREGTLELLQCGDTVEEVSAEISQRESYRLEEELADSGMCGAVIRSADEWMAHPQGQAISDVPVIEIIKVADGDPQTLPPAPRPLSGVRILDLTRVLAGPVSGRTMAAHGADVLHVRSPKLPGVDLFVADNSVHPASQFGCSSCHGGKGHATSFVNAVHTPDNESERER